jgi:integral membrane protein (TIGR01906 family)
MRPSRADDVARDRPAVRALRRRELTARRALAAALVVVIAVTVPPALVVNALRVLATETFTRWEIDRLEPDRYGLTQRQREKLALLGLEAIRPGSEGIDLLERARLPDGSEAFDDRELSHMDDVREVFGAALRGQLALLIVVVALALALVRTRLRTAVPLGLLCGALATLAIAVLAVPVILLGFDSFFVRFHELFFEGDSWRFADSDTLIRVYPESFWVDVSRIAAALTVAQAVLVAVLGSWWLRRARRALV